MFTHNEDPSERVVCPNAMVSIHSSCFSTVKFQNWYVTCSSQERKQYEVGCKFTWNIDTSQYRITDVLQMEEVKPDSWQTTLTDVVNFRSPLWNPTRRLATQLREKIQQPYAHTVRFLHNEMSLAGKCTLSIHPSIHLSCQWHNTRFVSIVGESITKLTDLDNLVQIYVTPMPNDALIEWRKRVQLLLHFFYCKQ